MLKFQLDTLEGVDEAVRALYTEKDGKFVLGIEGLPQQEDVSGLKAKVDELLGEKKAAEKKAREAEDAARLEREEAARKSGNVEELERSWTEKFIRREAELNGMLEQERGTLSGQIRDLTVGRTATDIASALAVQGSAKALLPHIERRLSVEQRDGKPVVVVLDVQGKLSAATLDELKTEIANDAAFAPLIAGSKASGGGAGGAGGGGGAPKGKIGGTKEERTAAIASRFPDLPQS
jgi:osmotically-inducible protein OsmY